MSKRLAPAIDPANACTDCGHLVLALTSGALYCPCEDCHVGGLIQGRVARQGSQLSTNQALPRDTQATELAPGPDDDIEMVDPLHSLSEDNDVDFEDLSDEDKRWFAEDWVGRAQG